MKHTNDQKKALKDMLAWSKAEVNHPWDLLYVLDGAAGTGKTTIVKDFIAGLGLSKTQIAVSAPTHQAKKVIQRATDFHSQTVQKLLGLRPDISIDDFNPNRPVFKPIADDTIQYYKYIIIDESSMLNKDIFKLIKEKSKLYNVRVVFLGDSYQIPPVGEEISKVFTDVKNKSTLEEVVRQDPSNPMFEILKMLRSDIRNNTETGIAKLVELKQHVSKERDKGFMCLTQKPTESFGAIPFGEELLKLYNNKEYEHNKDFVKFIAYTNDSVEAWSTALRVKLLGEEAKKIITVGEFLVGYKGLINKRANTTIIENSEYYVVTNVVEDVSEIGVRGYWVTMETPEGISSTVFIIDHTDPENEDRFRKVLLEKLRVAKQYRGGYWAAYYKVKEAHISLKTIAINPNLPAKKENKLCDKDLYYGYGCTTHKSQGSSYENVAVNLANLYLNYKPNERARLVYVALSRTKGLNLLLVIEDSDKKLE